MEMWEITIKQVIIEAVTRGIFAVLTAALAIVLVKAAITAARMEEEGSVIGALVVATLVAGCIATFLAVSAITRVLNPEFFAIKMMVELGLGLEGIGR